MDKWSIKADDRSPYTMWALHLIHVADEPIARPCFALHGASDSCRKKTPCYDNTTSIFIAQRSDVPAKVQPESSTFPILYEITNANPNHMYATLADVIS